MSSDLKIKIKQTNGGQQTHEIELNADTTIGELKLKVQEKFNILPAKQNLIFQGHILFDEKKVEECHIQSGDTILLVEKMSAPTTQENKVPNVQLQSGVGPMGQINYDLLRQPMGGNVNLEQMEEILSHPELAGQMEEMLKDPQVLKAMMENPAIKPMIDANPMMKTLMSNPEFMRNLLNPDTIRMMKNMMEGQNAFPMPGSSTGTEGTSTQQIPQMTPLMFNPLMMGMNNMNPNNQQQQVSFMNMFNPFMFNPMMMGGFPMQQPMAQQPALTKEQLKEKYKGQIAQLKEMGFDNEDDDIQALEKTNGNVEAAIERLVSGIK